MTITIGSNIQSLRAQQKLREGTGLLSLTFERLASGQRINRASDDAAGLAVSLSLNVNARVYSQGIRNFSDGLSLLSVADSALGELSGVVTRIRELSSQAANGTYGNAQREALDEEAQALRLEHNRILSVTEFNGISVFDASRGPIRLQDGYGIEGGISITIGAGSENEGGEEGIQRINVDSAGTQGNSFGSDASLSSDGRYVAFFSLASNLVAGDTNSTFDVFVHDRESGQTTRVNVNSSGTQANSLSQHPMISGDGRYVAFASFATNLVAGDTNGQTDVFVHDRQTGQTTRVSVDSAGTQGTFGGDLPSISSDGRYVAFSSSSNNLIAGDTNGLQDAFVHDRQTGQTTRVSVNSSGTQTIGGSSAVASISSDGRYVVFVSAATNLVAGDTNGFTDIFVRDRQTGETTRVNISSSGTQANSATSSGVVISGDGRYVAFESAATNLVTGDTNGFRDIFLHDRQTGQTTLVSVDSTGTQQADGDSFSPSLSADGRYLAFQSSATNLVAGDTNGTEDIFIRDLQTGETVRVNFDQSGTQANGSSGIPFISGDGRIVAFESVATNLIAGDTNGTYDIFVTANSLAPSSGGLSSNLTLSTLDLTTASAARTTMDAMVTQLDRISAERGKIGAFQSRIEAALGKLRAQVLEMDAASGRILDADIADESAKLVQVTILQQVAASVLAQANQQPALALELLR